MQRFCSIRQFLWCLFVLMYAGASYADEVSFDDPFMKHHVVMMLIDPESGQIITANHAASEFYGYSLDTLKHMKIQDINALSPADTLQEMQSAKREKRTYFIFKHRLSSGEERTVEVSSVPTTYHGKDVLFSIIRDISVYRANQEDLWYYQNHLENLVTEKTTLLKQQKTNQLVVLGFVIFILLCFAIVLSYMLRRIKSAHSKLAYQKERLNEVIWGTHVGTWEWDIKTNKVTYNERWAEMLGYRLSELEPVTLETWKSLCHPEDFEHSLALQEKHFAREVDYYECEMRLQHKLGFWIWVLDRGKVVEWDKYGKPLRMCGTDQDISRQKQLQQELELLAHYDILTKLPNRYLFQERAAQALQQALEQQSSMALLFVDLDDFKSVNDQFGHQQGDQLLLSAAQRMKLIVETENAVARIGGDEFAIVLDTTNHLDSIVTDLIEILRQPYELGKDKVTISASIGVAIYPDNGSTIEALLTYSDSAMYQAKKQGKGRAVYY